MSRLRRFFAIPIPILFYCCLGLCLTLCGLPNQALAAQTALPKTQKNAFRKSQAPHAHPWVFSRPDNHRLRQWRQGVDAEDLQKKAVPARKPEAVNTASAIDEALERAEQQNRRPGSLNVSIRNEGASFRDVPSLDNSSSHPGENPVRAGRHIVGAFADVQSGEDLHILVGPELSIKDELGQEKSAGNQPESALGMGMQFKLDF
ncbi:MAG: hypothetical protein LBC94_06585 [Desulfovibrio sp.]|jgi:hypothetical protein|nr:hypothetical protein [Desulfovibrio sp.]